MREIELTTRLKAPPDRVWREIMRPALLLHVARPLIVFRPLEPAELPERWRAGDYVVGMRLFGIVPIGTQTIRIEPQPESGPLRRLRDNGFGPSIRRWDHMMEVAPDGDGTAYTDRVKVEAGWRTPFVAAFARAFYAHRQRRWQRLVARGFDDGTGGR